MNYSLNLDNSRTILLARTTVTHLIYQPLIAYDFSMNKKTKAYFDQTAFLNRAVSLRLINYSHPVRDFPNIDSRSKLVLVLIAALQNQ